MKLKSILPVIILLAWLLESVAMADYLKWDTVGVFDGKGDANTAPIFSKGVLEIGYSFISKPGVSFAIIVRRVDAPLDEEYVLQVYGSQVGDTYYYGRGPVYFRVGGAGDWIIVVRTAELPPKDQLPHLKYFGPQKDGKNDSVAPRKSDDRQAEGGPK